jgi:hypothetical protein
MKLLAFFLLPGFHKKLIRAIFPEGKYWKHQYFWNYFLKGVPPSTEIFSFRWQGNLR